MIKLENTYVTGWEQTIRGMRNPMNSWNKSDSYFDRYTDSTGNMYKHLDDANHVITDWMTIGDNDLGLMNKLASAGPVHAKYRRMITVYVDITAPLYWWKEFDTYKVGTVANSCSTMHKIHDKEFTANDFSYEHLMSGFKVPTGDNYNDFVILPGGIESLENTIIVLNRYRDEYLKTKDKKYWWQMIQLLPSSYNQRRTVMLNYEVLANIYKWRKDHKLDEWRELCTWIESLPYFKLITEENGDGHV